MWKGEREGENARAQRVGLTLVELLVVIVILTTLVTTAIPVIAPGGDDRKIREASRQINAFFAGAQSRAVQTGRPYGVALKPLSLATGSAEDNGVVVELSYVEVPPPYAGPDSLSRARIAWDTADPDQPLLKLQLVRQVRPGNEVYSSNQDLLPEGYDPDPFPPKFLRPGDRIEIGSDSFILALPRNNQDSSLTGNIWEDARVDSEDFYRSDVDSGFGLAAESSGPLDGDLTFILTRSDGTVSPIVNHATHDDAGRIVPIDRLKNEILPNNALNALNNPLVDFQIEYPLWSAPLPYKIFRQPTPASKPPLQLAEGVAIDMQGSGFGNGVPLYQPSYYYDTTINNDYAPLRESTWFLFSPEGTLNSAYAAIPQANNVSNEHEHQKTFVTSSLALLVGRRELIPAQPTDQAIARVSSPEEAADEPIDLAMDLGGLTDEEEQELRNRFNWLNLESRWVVIGAQSGTISTVPNAFINPTADEDGDGAIDADRFNAVDVQLSDNKIQMRDQLVAARGNAPRRAVQGGR